MKNTPLIQGETQNYFDRDLLVNNFCKNEKIAKELPDLKDINSYQGFITKLEEKINEFDLEKAIAMTQLLIGEIDNDIKHDKEERVLRFIQENNIKEMDEEFLKLPQDKKILITQYWHENNKGENYSRDKNFGCGGYGYFKIDTTCGSCISGGQNLGKAGLKNLTEFLGDRQNKIPDEIIENATLSLFTDEDKREIDQLKHILTGYLQKIKLLEQQEKTRKDMLDFFAKYNQAGDYKTVLTSMPAFASYVEQQQLFRKNIDTLEIYKDDNLVIYSCPGSQINGTGPMTYRITTTIFYDGQEKSFRHIVRNPSNPDYYDTSFYRPTLKLLSKQEKGENIEFKIRVINNDNSNYLDYTTSFKKDNPNITAKLNEQDQEEFKKFFEKTMQEKCKSETRENGIMHRFGNIQNQIPRDKAEIIDKTLDFKNCIGAFILKTQIDCGASGSDYNKQYGRRGYIVNSDGNVNNVWYECGREEQLGLMDFSISDPRKIDKEKVKAIFNITAQSLLEGHLNKKSN